MIALQSPEDRTAAAGEYVLGTLDATEHTAFEAALAQDMTLRAEVYVWQDRLLSLSSRAPAAAPSASLWRRIDAAIGAIGATTRSAAAAPANEPVTPAAASPAWPPQGRQAQQPKQPPQHEPWWQRLGLWQGISGLAVALSLVMGVLLVQRLNPPEPAGVRYLAVLQSPDKQATGWVVELQAGRNLRLVPVADGDAVPAGRALQFWTKPLGAAGPTSLGLVRAGQTLELPLSVLPGLGPQQLFEITLEPENGSPIDRPTGPILYVGRTVAM